jgi:phosphoglycerol transferase MdoB-like AlkP superfamily enzyme
MKRLLQGSSYKVFFIRILFVFILFTISRIIFFAFNFHYFVVTTGEFFSILFWGLLFDMSAIIACFSPFIFFSIIPFHLRHKKPYHLFLLILFIASVTLSLAGNLLDCGYYRFLQSRSTADIFNVIGLGSDVKNLLPQYIKDYWFLFLILFALIAVSWIFFNKTRIAVPEIKKGKKLFFRYLKEALIFALISASCIVGFRGGFQLRPIGIITAGQFTSSQNLSIVLNTPFTIIKTFGKTGVKKVSYFDENTLATIYSPVHQYYNNKLGRKNLNVVIIILESFSKEYIGSLNRDLDNETYKGYTPFLDSLISESLVFPNAYANGKRSIDGIPSILAGIPALMDEAFITSIYAGNKFSSIANLLKEKGYVSSFYHGGTNGTMGFSSFTSSAGFDHYYGRTEYNNENDFDGKWGIFDEEFLQYIAENMDKSKKPYVAAIFTLSSHHPYTIPAKYKDRFPDGAAPILKSIGYTDYALKKFFSSLFEKPWFDSTLFVITADHTSEALYPEYKTRRGAYEIPLIFYQHNSNLKGENKTVTQQTDIVPSILHLLNYDKPFISYGESVFDSTHTHFTVSFANSTYQIIMDDYALVFDGSQSLSLYDLKNDSLLSNNIINTYPEIKSELEEKLKGFIQSFNNSLLTNKMTLDDTQ